MCRKVLDHLSQKIFSGLISESFHPNPLCRDGLNLVRGRDLGKLQNEWLSVGGVLVNVNTIICLRRANILIKCRDNGCTVASGTKAWVCRQKALGPRTNAVICVVAGGLAKIDQGERRLRDYFSNKDDKQGRG